MKNASMNQRNPFLLYCPGKIVLFILFELSVHRIMIRVDETLFFSRYRIYSTTQSHGQVGR